METEKGNFLNVTLKNKIIQKNTILDYLNEKNYLNKKNHDLIAKSLIGRSFKVSYSKRNYKIFDILFNRNPTNQTFNYEGGTVKLIDYYQGIKKLKINDENQPIIAVKRKGPQDEEKILYFIPELCFLAGLEENDVTNKYLMKQLSFYTKLEPSERINRTNQFLELLKEKSKDNTKDNSKESKNNNKIKSKYNSKDNEKKENIKDNLSAYEKSQKYGIEVVPVKEYFTAYMIKDPHFIGESNKNTEFLIMKLYDRYFPILKKIDKISLLCFYEKSNYNDADYLYKALNKASKGFGIEIFEPEWIEMPDRSSPNSWSDTADDYIGKGKDKYKFAVFLIGQQDKNGK